MDENKSTIKSININKICRFCGDMNSKLYSIFENRFHEIIECFIPIRVQKNDSLPHMICPLCKYKLITADEFRLLAISTDKKLREFLSNEKNNLTTIEDNKQSQPKNKTYLLNENDIDNNNLQSNKDSVELQKLTKNIKTSDITSERLKNKTEILKNLCQTTNINSVSQILNKNILKREEDYLEINNDNKSANIECNGDQIKYKLEVVKRRIKIDKNEIVICSECKKPIKRPYFKSHMKTHTRIYDKKCNICGALLLTNAQLWYHKKANHREKTVINCDQCGKSFKHNSNFHAHYQSAHLNIKKYKCEVCNRSFSDKKGLRTHVQSHTGERPHICHICGRGLSTSFALTQHVRLHTNEAPYKCSECGLGFKQNVTMKLHYRRQHLGITAQQERHAKMDQS